MRSNAGKTRNFLKRRATINNCFGQNSAGFHCHAMQHDVPEKRIVTALHGERRGERGERIRGKEGRKGTGKLVS